MKQEHLSEIKAIIILSLGMILLASLVSFVPEDLPWYTSHPNVPAHNLVRITELAWRDRFCSSSVTARIFCRLSAFLGLE